MSIDLSFTVSWCLTSLPLTHHSVELHRPLTMFSVTPIPERNIICPVPRDPARLILI